MFRHLLEGLQYKDLEGIMVENIEKLFDREEKLNIIAMKSQNLNQRSVNVHYQVSNIFSLNI